MTCLAGSKGKAEKCTEFTRAYLECRMDRCDEARSVPQVFLAVVTVRLAARFPTTAKLPPHGPFRP